MRLRHCPLLFLCLLLPAFPAHALRSDRDQPVLLEADQATISDRKGVGVYRGHVIVRQGSIRITGDVLTLHSRDGHIVRAIMEGTPATFRQRPEGKPEDMRARARRMVYEAAEGRLILTGDAVVWQGGDVFRSQRIVYDIDADRVEAGGSSAAGGEDTAGREKGRVHIILQPAPRTDAPEEKREPGLQ